ncbi:MAG: 3-dehydroquinate synthase [Saprospiraceae bacterium]|nr:3-dehydroquinate synthase [Saprospiraceae bacterium]MBP8095473.1 3-dehydroquinate synthase [Saprospiraceae bacterium]
MEKIDVIDYNIYMGPIVSSLESLIERQSFSSLFVLTDENTLIHCKPLLDAFLLNHPHALCTIPAGEIHKNIHTCVRVWQSMTEAKLDRHAIMINLGGGVIGDLGGFCASTYKRGIRFVQVPSTLLSQVDASIGGKLGIDFDGYKNHIGVFRSPMAVMIDVAFLKTLSTRELRSGYAEIIKHCLIADGSYWVELSQIIELESVDWSVVIRRSLEVKRQIVIEDPFEKGKRKLLNFGHTLGHAIESHFLESSYPLLHGEAIAAGMIYETRLSSKYLSLNKDDQQEIIHYIQLLYGPAPKITISELMDTMKQDKKNLDNKISFSLLSSIGHSQWDLLLEEKDLLFLES